MSNISLKSGFVKSLGVKEFGELKLHLTFVGSAIIGVDIILMWTGRASRG
jgi:hypothetical protein